jgi:hypothetical protein
MDCDRKVTYPREDRTQSTSVSTIYRERVCTRISQNSCGRCPPGVPASMLQRLPFRHNNTLTMHTTTCTGNGPYARISLCGILQHVLDALSLSLSLHADDPTTSHFLSEGSIHLRLVPRDNTARFVRRFLAAAHNVPIRVRRVIHERRVVRVAVASRIVVCPDVRFFIDFLLH